MHTNGQTDTLQECPDTVDCGPRLTIRSIGFIAHDLKNLLTGVLLSAERIALESTPPEDGKHALAHRILAGGLQMQQSINRLLETAAGEIRSLPFLRASCDLSCLLRHVLESNRDYALSKDMRLRFSDLGPGECWGQVDRDSLRMAVDNLVNNAIKFSPPGSDIQVTLLPHERGGAPFASIRVKDQGPGLAPLDKAMAFSPLHTLSALPTGGESSTGLGLLIVREIVERHGGKVWVESVLGHGATFCLELPLRASPEQGPGIGDGSPFLAPI